ncbi:MAG: glycosyltransferase [Armatimonadetes bacterium]|nr:glycosyltransferase [Armatimonadota bacterium]
MFNNVLILSASAGAGHIRAAQAIEQAFQQLGAAQNVRHIDTLQYTNKLFRKLYSQGYIEAANNAPEVLGWLYDQTDRPWKNERIRLAFDKLNTGRFIRMMKQYQPEIVVCTHFLPAEIISWLKAKGKISSKQAIVVTDFDIHALWLCHHYERYFVALEETAEHLRLLGIPQGKITVSGIPIDPLFATPKDPLQMRHKHGLDPDCTTMLVSAGGFGVGPLEHMIESLGTMRHRAQVVVLCGRNPELKERVEQQALRSASANVSVHALGFTTQVDELMAASDLLLGKPGGLTTSEALARGLGFVIVNPIPGQEERNSDHLLEQGVAIRCNNLPVLGWKIDRLLDDPARLAGMRQHARRLAQPNAAQAIVRKLMEA